MTTGIAKQSHPERGIYAGYHVRFVAGHHMRVKYRLPVATTPSEVVLTGDRRLLRPDQGYVSIAARNHPHTEANRTIKEHRYVMEMHLGRFLESYEHVHHKNGRRDDNRLENLELWRRKPRQPYGVRASDYHCPGCRCAEIHPTTA